MVISPDTLNAVREDVLVAAITSQIPATLAADEFLLPANALTVCGLPKPSLVRLTKMVSIHRQLVIKRIGALPAPVLAQVIGQIRQLF